MSGKGDDRRPSKVDEQTFSDNWERIFNGTLRAEMQASKPCDEGAAPSVPAIYVNADTGEQVTSDWWPRIEEPLANRSRIDNPLGCKAQSHIRAQINLN